MRDGEYSLHLATQMLQATEGEVCALVQIEYKLLALYLPCSSCHSSKDKWEWLGLMYLLKQDVNCCFLLHAFSSRINMK